MANVKKQDYEHIANIFNESGDKAAQEYVATTYGNKAPRGVISRIKKAPGFKYDEVNNKIIKIDPTEEKIFMGLDELCNNNNTDSNKGESVLSDDNSIKNIESLYIELIQEKLLELMKYVKINHYSKTISIDNSALTVDGYKVKLN